MTQPMGWRLNDQFRAQDEPNSLRKRTDKGVEGWPRNESLRKMAGPGTTPGRTRVVTQRGTVTRKKKLKLEAYPTVPCRNDLDISGH